MSILRQLRLAKGYTQTAIAAELEIPVSTYAMMELGARPATRAIAERTGELLGVDVTEIFLPERFTVRETQGETSATKETA